jgi:transcription elongation GreA/GreB family factor
VAPLARALSGKEVGDVIRFGEDEIEVLAVD